MKVNVPDLQDVADEMASLRAHGVHVVHHAHDLADALFYVGAALFVLAGAIIYAAEGSKVAAHKGGRRGR